MTSTRERLRDSYTQHERIHAIFHGMRREALPGLVRYVSERGRDRQGFILYSDLDAQRLDAEIRRQIDYFEGLGSDFEWKVYDYDQPPDLRHRLQMHGFTIEEPEAIMLLDLEEIPPVLRDQPDPNIVRITDPAHVAHAISVEDHVWGREHSGLGEYLTYLMETQPDAVSMFIAYMDDRPVSAAWIIYSHGGPFAGLWGGSTLVDYRRRGLYTGLLAARVQEAKARQVAYLTVDASPMSRPILERRGFVHIATAYACNWQAVADVGLAQSTR